MTEPWTREDVLAELEPFAALYEERPIRDNHGGMLSPHLFATWCIARALQPEAIVESGVFLGQGTWLFDQACPGAELHCIEPVPERIRYRSPRATYDTRDFAELDWGSLPRARTLLFFDDHQNAVMRVRHALELGFEHLVFEDNYPPGRGDCYSLKEALSEADSLPPLRRSAWARARARARRRRPSIPDLRSPEDADFLRAHLEIYAEFPPVFTTELTRWGDPWAAYPTPAPLLAAVEEPWQEVYLREARSYTWICYARLR